MKVAEICRRKAPIALCTLALPRNGIHRGAGVAAERRVGGVFYNPVWVFVEGTRFPAHGGPVISGFQFCSAFISYSTRTQAQWGS